MPIDPETQQRKEEELQAMEEFEANKKQQEAARLAESQEGPDKQRSESRPGDRYNDSKRLRDAAEKNKPSGQEAHQGAEAGGRGLTQGAGEGAAKEAAGQAEGQVAKVVAKNALRTGGQAALRASPAVLGALGGVFAAIGSFLAAVAAFLLPILAAIGGALLVVFLVIFVFFFFFAPLGGVGEASGGGGAGSGSSIPGSPRGCPVKARITTPYGVNIGGYPIPGSFHTGVDLGDGPNVSSQPVHSTLDGTVSLGSSEGGGFMVTVTNPTSGYAVKFLHLQETERAEPGSTVKVGDVIAIEDDTGSKRTAEHVHYEVYFNGKTVNPTDFMPAELNYVQPPNNDFSGVSVPENGWGKCDILPEDTIPGTPSEGLSYYILYGDTSIGPSNPERLKEVWVNSFPDSNIDKPCPGGLTCWDYVIQQSVARGISPAFSLTIWREEGGVGGILSSGLRAASQFGCFPGGDTSQTLDFLTSFNCFLNFTASEHPYNAGDPKGSFSDWAKYFCGPGAVPICSNNPNFVKNLGEVYDSVAPGKRVSF